MRELDPLPAFRARLIDTGVIDPDTATRIEAEAEQAIAAAVDAAAHAPAPEVAKLFDHVPATPVANTDHRLSGDSVVSP